MPAWLEVLEGSGDPFDEALCRLHRRWLARLPPGSEAVEAAWLRDYLRLDRPDWQEVEAVARALFEIGSGDVAVSVDDLLKVVERDMGRARPPVPRTVQDAVCSVESSALLLLQDHARCCAAGGLSPLLSSGPFHFRHCERSEAIHEQFIGQG